VPRGNTVNNSNDVLDNNDFTNGNFTGLSLSNDLLLPENLSLDWNAVFDNLNWV
jgi:hypothetical protein